MARTVTELFLEKAQKHPEHVFLFYRDEKIMPEEIIEDKKHFF